MDLPLVSVITVCYNAAPVIRRTMESVLEQTYPHLEYIVIDGNSPDGTLRIIREMEPLFREKSIPLKVVSEPDGGIYDAMNKGLRLSSGAWINFMNAGDTFCNGEVLSRLFTRPLPAGLQVLYGDTVLRLDFGQVGIAPKPLAYMEKKMPFCHQSVFVEGGLMRREGFDTAYRLAADYAFFYAGYHGGWKFEYVPLPVACFESEGGASSRNRLQVNREYARIHGVENTLRWKLWFVAKACRVKLKDALQHCLPKAFIRKIRERNYQRIVNRRKK